MRRLRSLVRHATVPALALVLVGGALPLAAQSASTATAAPAAPTVRPADPADVGTLDGIIAALYASISGPKDAPRDFDRLRTLFGPNARLINTGVGQDGRATLRNWSVEEYIAVAGPSLMARGFFEREIGRSVTSFGNVWHIMSVYDSKFTLEDAAPFQRGINSIQLFNSGQRWYILSVMWDSERAGNPIPAELITVRP
jgi:hypothetical protein